jgi:uncharacterized membrane protein
MTFDPILTSSFQIQLHIIAGLLAIGLGPVALYRTRRDRLHKVIGYTWVSVMFALAFGSLFIPSFASPIHFGLLHGLALFALWSLWQGIRYAIMGNYAAHQATFRSLYWNGLIVAGAFNFLPGRSINRTVFPETPELGYALMALIGVLLAWRALARRQPPQQAA